MVALYSLPALLALHIACVWDPDIWWHLRTGDWILQHHAVPFTDTFSTTTMDKPWQAYSWLFEVVMTLLYQHFGLIGIVAYTSAMVLAITVALHHLALRQSRNFAAAIALTALGCFALLNLDSPRPWHVTILFFVLELDILFHVRKTARVRELLWLPLIFALWANLHIQFIDGLLVPGLALIAALLSWRHADEESDGRQRTIALWMGGALLASLLATLLNPYGWHIYRVAYDLSAQHGVMNGIAELKAMNFRSASDYCVLLLALAAAGTLARARRVPLFETILFVLAVFLSFRSQRDIWIVTTVAVAILATAVQAKEDARTQLPRFSSAFAALIAVLLLWSAHTTTNAKLNEKLAAVMPVSAVELVKARGYVGPVFNDFIWGGYLMDSLRMPVSIDGRAALHGDEQLDLSEVTWTGQKDWSTNLQLASAGVVIGPENAALTQLLRNDPRFALVYEDKLAAVFIPRQPAAQR